jgi:hypothetical protein
MEAKRVAHQNDFQDTADNWEHPDSCNANVR